MSRTAPSRAAGESSTVNASLPSTSSSTGPSVQNATARIGANMAGDAEGDAEGEADPEGEADGEGEAGAEAEAGDNGSTAAPVPRVRKKRLGVDPSLIISEERSKRRRSPSPSAVKREDPDPKNPERAAALGRELFHKIMVKKASDGESMSEPFMELPNKKEFPDYYEMIKHPMSLTIVDEKLNTMEYQTLKEVCTDLGQMFTNAKRYNIRESLIFQYAKKLHKLTRNYYALQTTPDKPDSDSDAEQEGEPKAEATPDVPEDTFNGYGDEDVDMSGAGPSEAGDADGAGDMDSLGIKTNATRKRGSYMKDGPTVYKLIKPVLRAIKEARSHDGMGRDIAGIFLELPDRRDLPDYYRAIKQPISLKEIEEKMLGRKYDTYEEFFEDVELMCANAMVYNEDESEVYKDAQQIRDILGHQRAEVIERLKVPKVDKFRVKAASVTPVRFGGSSNGAPGYEHRHSPLGYGASPNVPLGRLPYGVGPQTATAGGYPSAPSAPRYLPPLPQGVVNEEIVATLDKYPPYEQQAWASSLPPLAQQMYRQILGSIEARKRGYMPAHAQPQLPPQHAGAPAPSLHSAMHQRGPYDSPGSASPSYPSPSAPSPSTYRPPTDLRSPLPPPQSPAPAPPTRQPPGPPLIASFDFTYSPRSYLSTAIASVEHRPTIRLKNMRGVLTHAVLIGPETAEVELVAYGGSVDRRSSAAAAEAGGVSDTAEHKTTATLPDMILRVNGSPSTLPRTVYEPTNGGADGMADDAADPAAHAPKAVGMKWTVPVPVTRMEMKVEVTASRGGAGHETSTIFINRQ